MNFVELLTLVAPETLVVLTALGALFIDLTTMRDSPLPDRMRAAAWLTVLGCAAATGATFLTTSTTAGYLDGMLVLNPLSQFTKLIILALTAATALISLETRFTDHAGEYFALLLLATAGMMFLVSTENILLIFVSLELLSLSLYIITAFNKRNIQSAESALKYFLFGGTSAAVMLFGLSLIYGLSGELNLRKIAMALSGVMPDPLLILALVMVMAGFAFKVAAVPFHLWAPDAYQGAPTPSAAFIASGSKVASFFVLAKVLMAGFSGAEGSGGWRNFAPGWAPMLAVLAALSVTLGNLAAIAQSSVRRLLAYSAVAHAGYTLVGLLASQRADGVASVLYYVTTYALTTVGAFGVVAVVQQNSGDDSFSAFAGLSKRAPLLSFCMMVFMLSLAGIPPLAGFFGKVYLFKSALFAQGAASQPLAMLWLVILALGMSAVSLYYYLQVLKQIYVADSPLKAEALEPATATRVLLAFLALAVVALGCAPDWILGRLLEAIRSSGF